MTSLREREPMAFTLHSVVPWGRSFDEYTRMFALSDLDLSQRILGCGDGPASFNCTLSEQGGDVVSVDPLYGFPGKEIRMRIDDTYEEVLEQTRAHSKDFVWDLIPSVEALSHTRMAAMELFLSDYSSGLQQNRYVEGSLPNLPFMNREFALALCSHFLFLYSDTLSQNFHLQSVQELCRVAKEVRIFPLLEFGTKPSRHLDQVIKTLQKQSLIVEMVSVPYEFQKGANQMLRIQASPP